MYTITVLLLPVLSQYKSGIPKITIGDLLLIFNTILLFMIISVKSYDIKIRMRTIVKNPFFWLFVYIILGTMLSCLTQYQVVIVEIMGSSMRFIFYMFCACVVSGILFDFNYFIRQYKKLVIFATLFLILQIFLFYFTNYELSGVIPCLENVQNRPTKAIIQYSSSSAFYRPSSIFLEPGYYAQYVLPYLAYLLFYKNISHRFVKASILTFACMLSTSGQGIIISFIIWVLYFIHDIYISFKKSKISNTTLMTISVMIVVMLYAIKSSLMQKSLSRLFIGEHASAHSRIFRGYDIYGQLKFIHKIIGVGWGHATIYIMNYDIVTKCIVESVSDYMNSIAYFLVNLGLVGFVIMVWIFLFLWSNTTGFYRICTCILLLLSAVAAFFTGPGVVFYLSIILSGHVRHGIHYMLLIKRDSLKYAIET